jgi:hypothetical protein
MRKLMTLPKALYLLTSGLLPLIGLAHSNEFHLNLIPARQTLEIAPQCKIKIEGDKRIIKSNGIPDHEVGRFPNRGNPNGIQAQNYHYEVTLKPQVARAAIVMVRQPFGIALNGVLFDPGTAEFFQRDRNSDWNYEALSGAVKLGLDQNHAHVQPNGAYHYHGLPSKLFEVLSGGEQGMTLVGWAADGFPIYGLYGTKDPLDADSVIVELKSSYQIKAGTRPSGSDSPGGDYDGTFTIDYEYVDSSGDLDECGGRFGVTPEFTEGTYYYVLTDDYPFIPRMFKGEPDPSFERLWHRRRPSETSDDHGHSNRGSGSGRAPTHPRSF